MYAAHFAAALAIKGCAPRAPAWALLTGAFIPDGVWIVLAGAGIEPADTTVFFDDWSHSCLSILTEASLFALLFYRRGAAVWFPVWLAVVSHFLLDLPIHPKPLALYPHSTTHFGTDHWQWGLTRSFLGMSQYWWVQCVLVVALLAIYAAGARRQHMPANLTAASCVSIAGLHFLF
jgi:hypothetical protein